MKGRNGGRSHRAWQRRWWSLGVRLTISSSSNSSQLERQLVRTVGSHEAKVAVWYLDFFKVRMNLYDAQKPHPQKRFLCFPDCSFYPTKQQASKSTLPRPQHNPSDADELIVSLFISTTQWSFDGYTSFYFARSQTTATMAQNAF